MAQIRSHCAEPIIADSIDDLESEVRAESHAALSKACEALEFARAQFGIINAGVAFKDCPDDYRLDSTEVMDAALSQAREVRR
jgi:hypothetical protein